MEVTEHHGDGIADAGQAHLNTFLRNVALKRMRNNKNRGTENPLKVPDKKLVGGDLPGKTTSPPPTPSRRGSLKLRKGVSKLINARRVSQVFTEAFTPDGKAFGREQRRVKGLTTKLRLEILNKIPALQMVKMEHRMAFAKTLKPVLFARGEVIIKEGDVGDAFYIIEHGSAVVSRRCIGGGEVELATLSLNDYFGEIALLISAPRTATVRAKLKCSCLYATKADFEDLIAPAATKALETKNTKQLQYAAMNKVPLFQTLSPLERRKILSVMGHAHFGAGEYICTQGEVGNAMYILLHGEVKVLIKRGSADDDTPPEEVHRYHAGDFFGELALINEDSLRTADCVCTCDVEVLYLHRLHFSGYPTLAQAIGMKNLYANFGSRKTGNNNDAEAMEMQELRRQQRNEDDDSDDVQEEDVNLNDHFDDKAARKPKSIFDIIQAKKGKRPRKRGSLLRKLIRQKITVSEDSMAKDFFEMAHEDPDLLDAFPKMSFEVDWLSKKHATRKINAYLKGALVGLPEDRTDEMIHLLYLITKDAKFWNVLAPDATVQQRKALCRHMKYYVPEVNREGKYVFRQGDRCSTMYICMSGKVSLRRTQQVRHQRKTKVVAEVTPGNSFGELALMGMGQRTESAVLLDPSEFIEISVGDYSTHLKSSTGLTVEDKFNLLKKCAAFSSWDPYRLFRLSVFFEPLDVPTTKILFHEGSTAKGLYIVRSGEVAFVTKKKGPAGDEKPGKEASGSNRARDVNAGGDNEDEEETARFATSPSKNSMQSFLRNNRVVSTISEGEFLGESLALKLLVATNKRYHHVKPPSFVERASAVVLRSASFLVLPERFIRKIKGETIAVVRRQWEMKSAWRIERHRRAQDIEDSVSSALAEDKRSEKAKAKIEKVLQEQGISKDEMLIQNVNVLIKEHDVTVAKMEKMAIEKQSLKHKRKSPSPRRRMEKQKKALEDRKLFDDDLVDQMAKDAVEARQRRREMVLRSLAGAAAQKNSGKRNCIAFVKPLPKRKNMPPSISPSKNVEKYKVACSPITFRTSNLPPVIQKKCNRYGVNSSTQDVVGTLSCDREHSSVIIDVFESQHMDKWDRGKIMARRDLRLRQHRSDPSLSRSVRLNVAHLHNRPLENVEWVSRRLRKPASEAINTSVPSWIPLGKLVMDRYKQQMDKLLDASKQFEAK
jgi:CRP-like cAMP-binding protein